MMNIYKSVGISVENLDTPHEGCWISLIAPTGGEVALTAEKCGLDAETIKAALDLDERSRLETEENYTMVIVNIPTVEKLNKKELYTTIPLSVIITKETVVTVCSEETKILRNFADGKIRDFHTNMKSRFIFQILYRTASFYLQYLRAIDKESEAVETKLHKSTRNSELIELLKLEKSLVYFTTALRSNEVVLEKLMKSESFKKYPEDTELLEDVIIENKQAIEMANIYTGILSGTMDAFASIISNNLNIVMKVLAIVTIILSVPTMIFSAYGMNIASGMPFAGYPFGFYIIVSISLVLSVVVALFFVKIKMFK